MGGGRVGIRKRSRRGFTGLILGLLVGAWRAGRGLAALGAPPPLPPAGGAGTSATRLQSCRYRADAAILFLGVTIYRRAGVGGGQASLEETNDGGASRMTPSNYALAAWRPPGEMRVTIQVF